MNHEDDTTRAALATYSRRALAGFVILAIGIIVAFWSGSHRAAGERDTIVKTGRIVSVSGCNRDFVTITKLRSLLSSAKASVVQNGKAGLYSKDRVHEAVVFYDRQLSQLKLPDCRVARTIVTDDPSKADTKVPVPLYPGSLEARKLG